MGIAEGVDRNNVGQVELSFTAAYRLAKDWKSWNDVIKSVRTTTTIDLTDMNPVICL